MLKIAHKCGFNPSTSLLNKPKKKVPMNRIVYMAKIQIKGLLLSISLLLRNFIVGNK